MTGRPRTCECGVCRKCKHRDAARARYQAMSMEERRSLMARVDKEKYRARDRARNKMPERIKHLAANTKRWRAANPERYKAQRAVAYAIKTGKLTKKPCEVCGETRRVYAHHNDYSKPLGVEWLCPLHHAEKRF